MCSPRVLLVTIVFDIRQFTPEVRDKQGHFPAQYQGLSFLLGQKGASYPQRVRI
jgi:hypothetical protein